MTGQGKRNILVIDDDIIVHTLSERIIGSLDCVSAMYSAFNGREAIDLLSKCCTNLKTMPEIVLLDLNMPVMNGLEFLKHLGDIDCIQPGQFTLAMISSTIDPREIEEAKSLGVRYFFSKPVSQGIVETLIKVVKP